MIKKIILSAVVVIILAAAFLLWRFTMPNTAFEEKTKLLYIRTGQASKENLMRILEDSAYIHNPSSFEFLAERMNVFSRLRPGRYEIQKGMSLVALARLLRNNQQSPVNFTITKIRTREQLASMAGRRLEFDSLQLISFLNSPDSLQRYNVDTNTVMTTVFPNTYTYFWNSTPAEFMDKLFAEYEKIWTEERKNMAQQQGLTPQTAYILASIIEEETNKHDEKDTMASVYLNRLRTNMRLGADPTVKFALRDFDLRRIYQKHLSVESPYNTYRNTGLPPGPICTPSLITLDAVLKAPATKYFYFAAKSDFSQRHVFAENYAQHLRYAREYQRALTELQKRKLQRSSDSLDDARKD